MRKFLIIFVIVVLLGGGGVYAWKRWQRDYKEPVPEAVEISQVTQKADNDESKGENTEIKQEENVEKTDSIEILPALNLKLAFFSQAPLGDWNYPWQEACEEASVLLVANAYFKHEWTREEFNKEILKLVEWEKKHFGSYEHTDVEQTVEMLDQYLNLKAKVHENPSYEDVQKILAQGHLIVGTFAGKELRNPFYTNGGPVYHAMVIKGYKEGEKVITHDVGTRRGEDYVYSWKIISDSLHDYAEPISKGPKRIIEVLPPE